MPNDQATEQSVAASILGAGGIPRIQRSIRVSGMTAYPTDKTLSISGMAADAKETGDRFNDLQADYSEQALAILALQNQTGEDIPLNSEEGAKTIAEAIRDIGDVFHPVGSIVMTVSEGEPDLEGTWVEIAITATYRQLKNGSHDYHQLIENEESGQVHFWLRTE